MADEFTSFDLARLAAVKEYAALEREIFLLFKFLMNTEAKVASAIFYQIVSARTRYAIIGSLLDIHHRWTFKRSWNRIERWLGNCDTARNHIIHWYETGFTSVTVDVEGDGETDVQYIPELRNSARYGRSETWFEEKFYDEDEIRAERDNIRVAKHIVNRFGMCICEPELWPWTDIYRQPVGDRTPAEFLQLLNDRGHPAPLPPYDQ